MKPRRTMLDFLADQYDGTESIPFLPIVELSGNQRVLIENHQGVISYCTEQIGIRMNYGEVLITGSKLVLTYMTKNKLVITGQISQITLRRGAVC